MGKTHPTRLDLIILRHKRVLQSIDEKYVSLKKSLTLKRLKTDL